MHAPHQLRRGGVALPFLAEAVKADVVQLIAFGSECGRMAIHIVLQNLLQPFASKGVSGILEKLVAELGIEPHRLEQLTVAVACDR